MKSDRITIPGGDGQGEAWLRRLVTFAPCSICIMYIYIYMYIYEYIVYIYI